MMKNVSCWQGQIIGLTKIQLHIKQTKQAQSHKEAKGLSGLLGNSRNFIPVV